MAWWAVALARGQLNSTCPPEFDLLWRLFRLTLRAAAAAAGAPPGVPARFLGSSACGFSLHSWLWRSAVGVELSSQPLEESGALGLGTWRGSTPSTSSPSHSRARTAAVHLPNERAELLPHARHCRCARDPAVTKPKKAAVLGLYI